MHQLKQKLSQLLFASVMLLAGLISGYGVSVWSAPNTLEINNATANLASVATPTPTGLLDSIAVGKKILAASPRLNFIEKTETTYQSDKKRRRVAIKTKVLDKQQVGLAILDKISGQIFERRYWLDQAEIKSADLVRRTYLSDFDLPHFKPASGSEDFSVKVNWWNYFNSDLSVYPVREATLINQLSNGVNPTSNSDTVDRYLVVGIKYLMENEFLANPADRFPGQKYSDIVYVPYSAGLHRPEIIQAGLNFLNSKVAGAFEQLNQVGVKSRAFPNRLITNTLQPEFIKNIFLTEQTDPKLVLLADDNGRKLAERVLVRLGTNGNRAFRYTYSKTGALGIGQIMPGTYHSIVVRYPEAGLIKDTDLGRVDIGNSIVASILVFDDHLKAVADRVNKQPVASAQQLWQQITSDTSRLNEVRAAIYNGGPGKYKVLTGTISLAVSETVDFVKKFKLIRGLSLF